MLKVNPRYSIRGLVVSQPFFHLGSVLHRRWIGIAPRGMVPGDSLKTIVAGLKNHGRFGWLTFHSVERNLDLAAGIDPMAEECGGAVTRVLRNGSRTVRAQA